MDIEGGIRSILAVTPAVFEMMLGDPVAAGAAILEEEPLRASDVTALVGFAGDLTGSISIHCSLDQARSFTARMLAEPPEALKTNDEIEDALGELVNMIGGNVKDELAGKTHAALAIPSVIIGGSSRVRIPGARAASVPFESSDGRFWVSLTFTDGEQQKLPRALGPRDL